MKIEKFNEAFKKLLGTSKKTVEIEVEFIVSEYKFDRKMYDIRVNIPGLTTNNQYIAIGVSKYEIEKEKENFIQSISIIQKNANKFNI